MRSPRGITPAAVPLLCTSGSLNGGPSPALFRRPTQGLTMSPSGTTDPFTPPASPPSEAGPAASGWTWAALAVAVAGLGGSLFLSLGMHLKACPLCFYQRTFAMSLVAVLGMGLLAGVARP